jgi:hypothetical protein
MFRFELNIYKPNMKIQIFPFNVFSYIQLIHQIVQSKSPRIFIYRIDLFSLSSDMRINCEYVDLSIADNSEQFSTDNSSLLFLLKSTWNSIEIQTNLDQRLLINANHWSFEFNHSSLKSKKFLINLFDIFV